MRLWGTYDLDDPFPLFAQCARGGAAARSDLARRTPRLAGRCDTPRPALLHDARLSKDMHAAIARDGGGSQRGCRVQPSPRHMLAVDPPTTPLRGWPHRR